MASFHSWHHPRGVSLVEVLEPQNSGWSRGLFQRPQWVPNSTECSRLRFDTLIRWNTWKMSQKIPKPQGVTHQRNKQRLLKAEQVVLGEPFVIKKNVTSYGSWHHNNLKTVDTIHQFMPRSPNEHQPGKRAGTSLHGDFPPNKSHHENPSPIDTKCRSAFGLSHASNMPEGPQSIWSKWTACPETRSHHPQIHDSKLLSLQLEIQPRIVDMARLAICHSICLDAFGNFLQSHIFELQSFSAQN